MGASSNRKSEITGIIAVLREKPVSVALKLPEFLRSCEPEAVLVGLEAVNHLALADARAHRAEIVKPLIEGQQADRVLEEHRRHADGGNRARDQRGDLHAAVVGAPGIGAAAGRR
ncbi:MAG: hypothetical protein WKG07_46580 [Hymenobacter sp.]